MSNVPVIVGSEGYMMTADGNDYDSLDRVIIDKMQIARNVVIHCEQTQNCKEDPNSDDIEKIKHLTGVSEETIRLADGSLTLAKTFTEWCQEKQLAETMSYCFVFGSIYRMILELYTEKGLVATKDNVLKGLLRVRCIRELFEQSRLIKDILRHGFTWKRIPGTKKSILIERSDQCLKRMEYFRKMKSYREAGRTIVYINVNFHCYQIVVSPQHGVLYISFNGATKGPTQCLNQVFIENFQSWAKNTLSEILPPNSVVVINEDPLFKQKVPDPYTSKRDMISWLTEREIPHDPGLHKADLYTLIKSNKSFDVIYGFLKEKGHDVVYRSEQQISLDFYEIMWPKHAAHRRRSSTVYKIKKNKLEDWQRFEKLLIDKEQKVYSEEVMLESMMDKLLTLAKYGELTPSDLEECDDELPNDEYYNSIILD